jgi:chorismate synthase
MLRYLTSGESHGRCVTAIVDGLPSGLCLSKKDIDSDLSRRKLGYGRGKRMSIESEILSGLRKEVTIGSPITLLINNADHSIDSLPAILEPRPGHADLAGILKYGSKDARDILERASARETAARVGVGAISKILLKEFGISILSHVIQIGRVSAMTKGMGFGRILETSKKSPVRCADPASSKLMCKEIDNAKAEGDTLGGVFEVVIKGVPAGLGSHVQWDRKIDAKLAMAILSIQAIKGVSFGSGFDVSSLLGSEAHDEIFYEKQRGFFRRTNNAGGFEGGMTNGENLVIRAAMKPIATLQKPLSSVNIRSKKKVLATVERSDVCAVPSAGVVGEAVAAIEIANALIEKVGGDSIPEMRRNFDGYLAQIRRV